MSYYRTLIEMHNAYEDLKRLDPEHHLLERARTVPGCKTLRLNGKFETHYFNPDVDSPFLEAAQRFTRDLKKARKEP